MEYKPSHMGASTGDLGAAPANSWVEFDVTPLVTKNGQYTFKLSGPATDGIDFDSRESAHRAATCDQQNRWPSGDVHAELQRRRRPLKRHRRDATRSQLPATPKSTPTKTATPKSTPTKTATAVQGPSSANPMAGAKWFIDPSSPAKYQADAWRTSRPSDAAMMDKIAQQPIADWFDKGVGDIGAAVDRRVSTIAAAGALPVLVAYNIPLRDCVSGGATSASEYQSWIRSFAAAIGSRKAIVILEPDALANITCLSSSDQTARLSLIKDAVTVLEGQPGVSVYVDAGHSNWVSASTMADLLTKVGIQSAQGFALNVSSFGTTADNIAYGNDLSARVGGKHFVIDTGRNGLGPTADFAWCNPPGRALGSTTDGSDRSTAGRCVFVDQTARRVGRHLQRWTSGWLLVG